MSLTESAAYLIGRRTSLRIEKIFVSCANEQVTAALHTLPLPSFPLMHKAVTVLNTVTRRDHQLTVWFCFEAIKLCSDCHSVCYCSKACQVSDWPRHVHQCRPLSVASRVPNPYSPLNTLSFPRPKFVESPYLEQIICAHFLSQ